MRPPSRPSLSVGILFIAYALQVKFRPFLDPNLDMAEDVRAVSGGAALIYVSVSACVHAGGSGALCLLPHAAATTLLPLL